MSRSLLVFTLLTLRTLSSNLSLPNPPGTPLLTTNTTALGRPFGTIIDEKYIKPVTELKLAELDRFFADVGFLGMDLRFRGPLVHSPIHIAAHSVMFNTTQDPPDVWRAAISEPSNWTVLAGNPPITVMQSKGRNWAEVNWNINEMTASFDKAIERLRAAGCAATFISVGVSKSTEMGGPARIWFMFDYYRGRLSPMTHRYYAYVSDDPDLPYPVFLKRTTLLSPAMPPYFEDCQEREIRPYGYSTR